MTALQVLDAASGAAFAQNNNFGDTRSGGLAGPMGLFIVLLLMIATVLLIRNMSGRIKRLPDRFPDQDETPRDPAPREGRTDDAG
ncbi:MAG TPA: hypothetical protein VK453_10805 [Micromonosporaceae bacterium]|nr:hypothetical protein [Micromonosporaceae bacterium]